MAEVAVPSNTSWNNVHLAEAVSSASQTQLQAATALHFSGPGSNLTMPLAEMEPNSMASTFVFPSPQHSESPDQQSPFGFAEAMRRRTTAATSVGSSKASRRQGPAQLKEITRSMPDRHDSVEVPAHPNLSQYGSAPLTRTQFQDHTPRGSLSASAAGHRRKGSELIGTAVANGEPTSAGLSPTKPSLPSSIPSPTTHQSRRHERTRSTAIPKASDLNLFESGEASPMKTQSASTPSSPSLPVAANKSIRASALHRRGKSILQHSNPLVATHSQTGIGRRAASFDASSPGETPTPLRSARVGFAHDVQYIPRPLSVISSEGGSIRTLTARHSAANSISSLNLAENAGLLSAHNLMTSRSLANGTSSTAEQGLLSPEVIYRPSARRARSFGELLQGSRKLLSNSNASHLPDPGFGDSATRWRFFGRFSPSVDSEVGKTSYFSDTAIDDSSNDEAVGSHSTQNSNDIADLEKAVERRQNRLKKSERRRSGKWGHSMSTKPQATPVEVPHHRGAKDSVTGAGHSLQAKPPVWSPPLKLDLDDRPAPIEAITKAIAVEPNGGAISWKPRSLEASEITSPVIDLDAALGPFQTPALGPGFKDPKSGGFAVKARRMHSGGEREQHNASGPFLSGPQVSRWHKRTVSAPVPNEGFDWGEFGFHQNTQVTSMPDLAEENEDSHVDISKTENPISEPECCTSAPDEDRGGITMHPVSGVSELSIDGDQQAGLGGPGEEIVTNATSEAQVGKGPPGEDDGPFFGGPGDEITDSCSNALAEVFLGGPGEEIVEEASEHSTETLPRPDSNARSSSSTVHTLLARLDPSANAKSDSSGRTSQLPHLIPPTPTSMVSSNIPSPTSIHPSFDEPRLLTAGSSFTDEYPYESARRGGVIAGDVRGSVSDIPSLVSSISPHASAVNVNTLTQLNRPATVRSASDLSGPREGSIAAGSRPQTSARPSFTTQKRASLLSLGRLVHSNHSKSKLSVETSANEDESTGPGKRQRFSKLLHFWRSRS